MSIVQDPRKTWLATGSLVTVWWRMLSLGPRLPLAFRLWLLPTCLSASGWEVGWSAASYLSSGICSILCSVSRPGCGGVLSLSFFSLWLSHSLGCYLTLALSDCPQGIQAWSPPYAYSPCLLIQPLFAAGGYEHLGYLSTGSRG